MRSKGTPKPKRKKKRNSEATQNAAQEELKFTANSLMHKLRKRPKKRKLLLPNAIPQKDVYPQSQQGTDDLKSTSVAQSADTKKAEKADIVPAQVGKEAEPKETLFQQLSLRRKPKTNEMASQQQASSAEKEQPASQSTTAVGSKEDPKANKPKAESDSKSESTPASLFQLLSFRVKRKKSSHPGAEGKGTDSKDSQSISTMKTSDQKQLKSDEVDVDPSKETKSQSGPPKVDETLFQMISRRIRRKKRSSPAASEQPPVQPQEISSTATVANKEQAETTAAADGSKVQETTKTSSIALKTATAETVPKEEIEKKKEPVPEVEKKSVTRSILSKLPWPSPKATTPTSAAVQEPKAEEKLPQLTPASKSCSLEKRQILGILQRLRLSKKRFTGSDSELNYPLGSLLTGLRKSESETSNVSSAKLSSTDVDKSLFKRFLLRKTKQQTPTKATSENDVKTANASVGSPIVNTTQGTSVEAKGTADSADSKKNQDTSVIGEVRLMHEKVKKRAKGLWRKYITKETPSTQPESTEPQDQAAPDKAKELSQKQDENEKEAKTPPPPDDALKEEEKK
ncbi:unnamed protein product [Strongylus vulgaris]|uniref:Uncharacterized protein n=1 Tax=Strongylus vulgaris TaxID=40348 RepID=A0A3P7IM82_STRVU|nr:unnamed protein product [Strongylus vulgaris]